VVRSVGHRMRPESFSQPCKAASPACKQCAATPARRQAGPKAEAVAGAEAVGMMIGIASPYQADVQGACIRGELDLPFLAYFRVGL